MKVYSSDGSVLMEVKKLGFTDDNKLQFTGTVMGSMPVQGSLSPEEARGVMKLVQGGGMWWRLLTFLFRRSGGGKNG